MPKIPAGFGEKIGGGFQCLERQPLYASVCYLFSNIERVTR